MSNAKNQSSGRSYLEDGAGAGAWLGSTDHKRVAVLYLVGVVVFLLAYAILSAIGSVELMFAGQTSFRDGALAPWLARTDAVLIGLIVMPAIPAVLGNFVLPLLLGARNVAFPRLNLFSFNLYAVGGVVMIGSAALGGASGGFLYMTGGAFAVVAAMLVGLNLIATIHVMRAPGLGWGRLPIFAWSLYASSAVNVLLAPVIVVLWLMTLADASMGLGLFEAAGGGTPLLFQHLFWFGMHGMTVVSIVPALGIAAEVTAVHCHKQLFGRSALILMLLLIAPLAALGWGQNLYADGQSEIASVAASLFGLALGVPLTVIVLSIVATMRGGAVRALGPMSHVPFLLWNTTIAGFAGMALASPLLAMQLSGTRFEAGWQGYLLIGCTFTGFLCGLHHWWPKITGRRASDGGTRFGSGLIWLGVNLSGIAAFELGAQGMPQLAGRYFPEYSTLAMVAAVGGLTIVAGFLASIIALAWAARNGKRSTLDPWGACTLEWSTAAPPTAINFPLTPVVERDPYDFPEAAGHVGGTGETHE